MANVASPPFNPIAPPAPSLTLYSYERGSQAILIPAVGSSTTSATSTIAQVGTAAPVGSNIFGVVAVTAYGDQPSNIMVQVDINRDGGSGAFSTLTLNLLGSLDGVHFYVIATFAAAAGGLFAGAGVAGCRYLAASVTTATVSSGTPNYNVSMTIGQ